MELTEEMEQDITKWCQQAVELKLEKRDVKKKFKAYPRAIRRKVLKIFKMIKKDTDVRRKRYIKMPKFKQSVEEDDETEEEDPADLSDEEMEELDNNPPKKEFRGQQPTGVRRPIAKQMYEEAVPPVDPNRQRPWEVKHTPERFQLFDPNANRIVLEAGSIEELNMKIAIMQTQHSVEAARNTR